MRGEIDLDARGCLTLGCYRLAPIPSVREVRELARPPIEFDVPLTLSHPFLTPCSVGAGKRPIFLYNSCPHCVVLFWLDEFKPKFPKLAKQSPESWIHVAPCELVYMYVHTYIPIIVFFYPCVYKKNICWWGTCCSIFKLYCMHYTCIPTEDLSSSKLLLPWLGR